MTVRTDLPLEAARGAPPAIGGRRIATAAALIMLGNVVSRIMGLAREQTIAALVGTTAAGSVFSAASRVPTMVYDLLIGGAITAALVPVFSEYAARDEARRRADPSAPFQDLQTLASAVLGLALATLAPAVSLLVLFARPLMALLGVGFEPAVQEQGIVLVRVALPSVVLLGMSAVLMGVLYALHRVLLPSYSAAIYNLGIIVCALLLWPWLGVTSLVLGVLAGAACQVLLQLPGLRDLRVRPSLDLRHPGVRHMLRLYAPVAAGLLISAAVVTLDTRLASLTGDASLAAMRYATTLVQLPLGLVATALSFATLPVLARYGAGGISEPGFRRTLATGLKAALLLEVPAMVGLIAMGQPVVRLLFERGAFGAEGTSLTYRALLFYAPQLPFVAVDQLLIAAFYALQNTLTPVLVGLLGAGVYAAVAFSTVERMGMSGLVLANTVQNSVHAVVLLALIWRAMGSGRALALGGATARMLAAGASMAAVLVAIQRLVPPPGGALQLASYLAVVGALSAAAYLGVLAALRSEELVYVGSVVRTRMGRSAAARGVVG